MTDPISTARFSIGEVVRHRLLDFRGVIFDVDPAFDNSEEWYEAIPEAMRPAKDQPFYHLLAENQRTPYAKWIFGLTGLRTFGTKVNGAEVANSSRGELYVRIGHDRTSRQGNGWNVTLDVGTTGDSRDHSLTAAYTRQF